MDVKKEYERYFGAKVEHSTSTHDAYEVVDFIEFLLEEKVGQHETIVIQPEMIMSRPRKPPHMI